jgi:tetrahydromethanopterin S-methyltransferase subunit G
LTCLSAAVILLTLDDYELIAERLSEVSEQVRVLENRVSDVLTRMTDVEKVNVRLEEAALITARALAEISGHWDQVYESMRRRNHTEEAAE